jgi:hypothetical protein
VLPDTKAHRRAQGRENIVFGLSYYGDGPELGERETDSTPENGPR